MAKGQGRGQQIWRQPRVKATVAAGALATLDVAVGTAVVASDTDYLLMSADISYTWQNYIDSAAALEGPIMVGIAAGDYTATEIEECLEASASIQLDDRIAQEQSNRLVRTVGMLSVEQPTLNEGMPVKTKLNWRVPVGSQPQFFIYNQGAQTLTTGSALNANGHFNIKFL